MKSKVFLAGKAFELTARQASKFSDRYPSIDAPSYIMFESTVVGDFRTFSLYTSDFRLLIVDSVTGSESYEIGINEMFSDTEPVNDFYKKKVKSNKKERPQMALSALLKKALSKDLRAMFDLGYLDSDLHLTEKGTDWLLAELLDMNKTDLGKVAQAELSDRKKKKKSKKD